MTKTSAIWKRRKRLPMILAMSEAKKVRMNVDIDKEVRDAVRIAAAESLEDIRDFVNRILREACHEQIERLRRQPKPKKGGKE